MAEKNRKKFLDKEGMDYLVGRILELLEEKSDKDLSNVDNSDFADKAQKAGVGGAPVVTATSTDGENYKSTVNGVVQLTTGMTITIIPNITSTKTSVNLDINDLGAKPIRMRTGYDTGTTEDGVTAGWMTAQKPVQLQYDGTCWIADLPRADANAVTTDAMETYVNNAITVLQEQIDVMLENMGGGFIEMTESLPVGDRKDDTLYGLVLVDFSAGDSA